MPVTVELDVTGGLPGLTIVGLGDAAVRESRERVLAALRNSGYELPPSRVTVNLAPADLKKEGSGFDLPIALGIICALRAFPPDALAGHLVVGELSLSGEITGASPAFPAALLARSIGLEGVVMPADMAREAALVEGCRAIPADHLSQVVDFLRGNGNLAPARPAPVRYPDRFPDLSDVRGQEGAKRALEISAAGGHHLLLIGPPGSGKSMLAARLPGILPPLTDVQSVEVTCIHSVAGLLGPGGGILRQPPYRAPHHTISHAGMAGGGTRPSPGEITLAHGGVLFLDEMPEFSRSTLETLRQPLEEGRIVISRAAGSVTYPARLTLIGAMNPCPCGFLGHHRRPCTCAPSAVARYRKRLSGALLDRLDLFVEVGAVEPEQLQGGNGGEPSEDVRRRVLAGRSRQQARPAAGYPPLNSLLTPPQLEELCPLSPEGQQMIERAVEHFGLTARGYHRVLRVARTIADLDDTEFPTEDHLAEAIQYRPVLEEQVYGF